MANFFAELKRRHVYRVAAAYVVVSWLILQVVNNVAPGLNLPNSAVTLVIVLLAAGFPIALIFAWIFDIKATGPADSLAPKTKTTALDFVLIGALVAVLAVFFYQQLSQDTRIAQQASIVPAPPSGGISVAVLPFVNLSSDKEQDFFSDGMTEEITSALAKVSGLNVVARTSAFQFKGQNRDVQDIAQALHAAYLIEGSVRKDGIDVRITAQLIRARDGTHLWTESYDRELKGVFAVQEEIAKAIAGSLGVPLGLKDGQSLVSNRTNDTVSYQDYLRGRALVRARMLPDAIALLEPVVARDPGYAPAWAMLAQAYDLTPNQYTIQSNNTGQGLRRIAEASLPRAEMAARRAIQLDDNLADAYTALARLEDRRGKILLAEEFYSKALALDPNNPEALHAFGMQRAAVGRIKEAVVLRQRLGALEPFVPVYNFNTAITLWLDGQDAAAIAMSKALPPPFLSQTNLSRIYAAQGRYNEAADALESTLGTYPSEAGQAAAQLLRTAPTNAVSPQLPPLGLFDYVYAYVGTPERILEFVEGQLEAGYLVPINNALLWHASNMAVRKTERFKAFARKAGMVEYWRARGWPDLCRPMGADDFVCD